MVNKKFFPEQRYTLIDQLNFIEQTYPRSTNQIRQGVLYSYLTIKPTPISKEYVVKIKYRMGKVPTVCVHDPFIDEETADKIPHKYGIDFEKKEIELCLYMPKRKEWGKLSNIALTLIPWTYEWLTFYEIWKVTGVWNGGGEHPKIS